MIVAGVDGTKGGWVAIVLEDGCFRRAHLLTPIESRFQALADAEVIAIDIPIGFGPPHPELSFRAMNADAPLGYRKKSAGGVMERIELLRRNGIELGDLGPSATAPIDDVLDAAACAWTAQRIGLGKACSRPDPPEIVDGLRVAIWC